MPASTAKELSLEQQLAQMEFEMTPVLGERESAQRVEEQNQPTREQLLEQQVQAANAAAAQARGTSEAALMLQQMYNHPVIGEAIRSVQNGRKVKLVEDGGPVDEKLPEMPVGETDPAKLATALENRIVGLVKNTMRQELGSVDQRFAGIEGVLQNEGRRRVDEEVLSVQQEFGQEFEDLKPKMLEINKKTHGLTPRQIFALAKLDNGGGQVSRDTGTYSERPSTVVGQPNGQPKNKTYPPGQTGRREMIQDAFNRIRVGRGE